LANSEVHIKTYTTRLFLFVVSFYFSFFYFQFIYF